MKKIIIIIFSLFLLISGFFIGSAFCFKSHKEKEAILKELESLKEAKPLLEAKRTKVIKSLGLNLVGRVTEISDHILTISGEEGSLKVKAAEETSIYLVTPRSEGLTKKDLIKFEEIRIGDQIYAYFELKELPKENEIPKAINLIITRSE
jgi:hypothetical protein